MPRVPEEYLEAREAEILRAAATCFSERGVHGTSMQEVASEAELSVGTLYRYFDGKEDLVRALAEAGRSLNRKLREAAEREGEAGHGRARQRLLRWIRLYLDLLSDPEKRGTLTLSVRLWAEALDDEVIGEELRRTYREQLATVRRLLREAVEEEGKQDVGPGRLDPDAAARAVISLLNDASLQVLIDPKMDLDAYGVTVERIVRGMLDAG